jgi:hypothetical protein
VGGRGSLGIRKGKTINNNDYVDAWENGGTAKIPIINSSKDGDNPSIKGQKSPYPYASGILLHNGCHSGKETSTYPAAGCQTIGGVDVGLLTWEEVWKLLSAYQNIFIYVNRDYFKNYSDYRTE